MIRKGGVNSSGTISGGEGGRGKGRGRVRDDDEAQSATKGKVKMTSKRVKSEWLDYRETSEGRSDFDE